MATLREISEEIDDLLNEPYDENDPEAEAEIHRRLNELNMAFDKKIVNIGKVRLEQKSQAKALGEEIARLQKKKKSIEREGKWLDSYALGEMLLQGIDKVQDTLVTISVRKSPPSVKVDNADMVHYEFLIERPPDIDKKGILDYWHKRKIPVPGTRIIDDAKHLRIS